MAANLTDKLQKSGASTVTTLAAPGKALGATSLTVGSTTNYPTDTGITIAIRVVDTDGELVAGTYTEWTATVSSATSFSIDATPVYGSDQVYAAGSTTQVFMPVSSASHNRLIDGLLEEHNQDGTHGVVTATSVTTTGAVTAGSGMTVSAGSVSLPSASINQTALPLGAVVQVASTNFQTFATGTTVLPGDSTIPQITEGFEVMTQAITPKSSTNILVITVNVVMASSVTNDLNVALFQDATANALAAVSEYNAAANAQATLPLTFRMVAGTTSATTFRVRIGGTAAGTTNFNGKSGTQIFGGVSGSSIVITEYKA